MQEGRWAGKYAGLSDKQAFAIVSRNIDTIVGTITTQEENQGASSRNYQRDFLVWEGNPLKGEGTVVLVIKNDGKISNCWPGTEGTVL